jgi:hypothetical protein
MFALGCIQAQTCHTGECPTGVTTQDPQRQIALVVPSKADRVMHFQQNTLIALQELLQAAGLKSPQDLRPEHITRRVNQSETQSLADIYPSLGKEVLLKETLGKVPEPFKSFWAKANPESFTLG